MKNMKKLVDTEVLKKAMEEAMDVKFFEDGFTVAATKTLGYSKIRDIIDSVSDKTDYTETDLRELEWYRSQDLVPREKALRAHRDVISTINGIPEVKYNKCFGCKVYLKNNGYNSVICDGCYKHSNYR